MTNAAHTTQTPDTDETQCTVWRNGDELFMRSGESLCDHCYQCNAPVGKHRRSLQLWEETQGDSPFFAIFLFGVFAAPILMFNHRIGRVVSKVQIGHCRKHKKTQRICRGIAWVFWLHGLALLLLGIFLPNIAFLMTGGAIILLSPLICIASTSRVQGRIVDNEHIAISGCCPAFLEHYPQRSISS